MGKGIAAVLLASVAYGVMPIITKLVIGEGLSPESFVFYRFLFACLCSLGMHFVLRLSIKVTRRQFLELALFGVLGLGLTINLLTQAYTLIDTGFATMLHFSYPLFVTVAMVVLFKEKLTLFRALSVAAALGGIALMTNLNQLLSAGGVLLALLSGVTYAVFVVASRRSSFSVISPMTVIFYVTFVSLLVFGAQTVITGSLEPLPSIRAFVGLLVIAVICTVLALYLLTVGIRILGSSRASILNMLEPITSVIAGMIVFGERLSLASGLGCLLVLSSTFLIILEPSASTRKEN